ncbi:cytochrome P450 87A3-like [Gossypium australe]|uniref:Cytochrome P450 87A3-like n=1 Tax=Gossypium australe TaxID=47621 RepID=A0A5B6VEV1_9ROSI|nr:cytochrome P450 87A3-like [Gossypium australe]
MARNFIPFGGGVRQCAGAGFSKVLMAVFLHVWVTKLIQVHKNQGREHSSCTHSGISRWFLVSTLRFSDEENTVAFHNIFISRFEIDKSRMQKRRLSKEYKDGCRPSICNHPATMDVKLKHRWFPSIELGPSLSGDYGYTSSQKHSARKAETSREDSETMHDQVDESKATNQAKRAKLEANREAGRDENN